MEIERNNSTSLKLTPDLLAGRLWDFAARIGKVVDALPETRLGRHVAGQLVRCGTSAPPNYDEACAAESRADFRHKISVALEEQRETRGWLRFIIKTQLLPSKRISNVLGQSALTAKLNANGPRPTPRAPAPN